MHLPQDVSENVSQARKTKPPEVVNIIGDAETVLEEFDITESGNQIHSYVKVKPGDKITLSYAIPGIGEQIVDVYIDGILRETRISNLSKMGIHRGHVKKVCACEVRPSGVKGKMEYYEMTVEERKTSKDISPSSPSYGSLQPSAVGTIEVRVLRELSLASDLQINNIPDQAIRGPSFEDSLRWWNVSGRVDPGIIAPAHQIGFINGRKTKGSSRKNVKRSVDGYYLWASFKFFYRSASDIEAAGLRAGKQPETLPSTNTTSRTAHLSESSQGGKLAITAATAIEAMAPFLVESSTNLSVHHESSGLIPVTADKERKDNGGLINLEYSQADSRAYGDENEMKETEDNSSKNVKIEVINNLDPLRSAVNREQSEGTPLQEHHKAGLPILNQGIMACAEDQNAIIRNGNFDDMSIFAPQHENLEDGFENSDVFDPNIKSGTTSAVTDGTATLSSFSPSSFHSGGDEGMVSGIHKDTNVTSIQKISSAQYANSNSLTRAKAGHYISRSPLVDKEDMQNFEIQAKSMTNGKGDWRNRAAKMLEVVSAPLKDNTPIESFRSGIPNEATTARDLSNELSNNPVSNLLNKRKLDQFNLDSSPPTSGSKPPLLIQLGQGMSPKQVREEHARKKMAKEQALKIKMEEAAKLRRQVEEKEAERTAQQELELQDLDAETEKFEAEAQAWAARLRELSEE